MSKTRRVRALAAAAAALAAAFTLRAGGGASAQRAVGPAAATKAAAVRAATAEVLRETSEVRQLAVLRQVRSGAQTRAEIERMLVRNLDENSTREETRAAEQTLKKLGLLPPEFQLRPFLVRLLAEQVAGYYDPKTRRFYLADWIDLDAQKPVIAHELTHALQDQHFGLRRFERWPKHDSDAELAAHALVEGDATLLMTQYVTRDLGRQLAMLRTMAAGGAGATEVYDGAPRVLRESLVFPYTRGAAWAGALHRRGGWAQVSAAYRRPPASTEQVLHPEKYFANEAPRRVAIRDVSASLGAGWRMADHDVNGEWGCYLVLDEILRAGDLSRRAAEGWGGDRYALFTGPMAGDLLVAQKTVWDTEQDAEEFFDAYARRTTRRYGLAHGEEGPAGELSWETGEGGVYLLREGAAVVVLEGLPPNVAAKRLAKAL